MKPIVAIIGRPNVGKSTLFNRIIGRRKAITLDESGITRDRHYGKALWEGREFICVDTGGLVLDGEGAIEKKVREQAELALQEASVIVFVMDGQQGVIPEEKEIARKIRKTKSHVIFAVNKIDGPMHEDRLADFYSLGEDIVAISSEHGYKVNDLLDLVVQALPPKEPEEKEAARPVRIALVGLPNVGKSSLLNRLLGEERAIVHNEPGTTRDTTDTPLEIDGKSYLLLDTAGIRRKGKSASLVERYSVLAAIKAIERSDLCLLVLDASKGIQKQDAHVAGYIQEAKKGIIIVWNKWDLIAEKKATKSEFEEQVQYKMSFLHFAPMGFVSAFTGYGCERLWPTINRIYDLLSTRISTSQVNKAFERLVESHNVPVFKGKQVSFYYATQTKSLPPTFVIFVNEPKGVHFSYQRYLANGFRELLNLQGVPLELIFRKKRR